MAKSKSNMDERERPLQDITVVDVDVHTSGPGHPEIAKDVIKHLDEPYKSRLDPDVDTFGSTTPRTGHGVSIPGKVHGTRMSVTDPEEDINQALCEEFGVDYALVNTIDRLDAVPDSRRIGPEMRAVNNMLLERFLDKHDHLYGLMGVAMRNPEQTAEEIDRVGSEDKIRGIFIHPGGQERAPGDPRYDPIYQAAEDNDLAVCFHGTGGGMQWNAAGLSRGMNTYLQVHALGHPFAMMWTLTSLITEGVPEKFPDLNFVVLESGMGWVPYMMYRLNREYGQRRSEAPLLEKSPEQYIRDQFYFATQPLSEPDNPGDIQKLLELVGSDSLMFSTDHPHFDFDNPESIHRYFQKFSDEERDKIFHQNAADVFDLPI